MGIPKFKKVCVIGGGGYVGSALVPALINEGYEVTVLDTFWYGFLPYGPHKKTQIKGDIRNTADIRAAMAGQDAVIHLACISNDPSFELSPTFGKSINLDCFPDFLAAAKECFVKRIIYASSSSVYGVKAVPNVTEDMECDPITDYSRFKLLCEYELQKTEMRDIEWTIVRPSTVCGFAPRLRLDLIVNILTLDAITKKKITVHGGEQMRPNLNIKDMVKAYLALLKAPAEKIHREIFNVGFENLTVSEIAEKVHNVVRDPLVKIEVLPVKDNRSYHTDAGKIFRAIGFKPEHSINNAIASLVGAYYGQKIKKGLDHPCYHNIARMKEIINERAL